MAHAISPIVYTYTADTLDEEIEACLIEYDDSRSRAESEQQQLVDDQLVALLELETSYKVEQTRCINSDSGDGSCLPYEQWRRKITEWSYRIVDHFRVDREVVSVAMNYFDRYLSRHKPLESKNSSSCQCPSCQRLVDSRTFQLAAMTCLYLAIKVHAESCPLLDETDSRRPRRKKIKLLSFVDLSRGQFAAQDLARMELDVLETLQWKVNPITSSLVVSYLLQLMPAHCTVPYRSRSHYDLVLHVLHEMSRYLSELAVCVANISSAYLPSEVAYAAILVSMDMLTVESLPMSTRDDFCSSLTRVSSSSSDRTTTLDPTNERICFLMGRLRQCFWPDMLLSDEDMGSDHPIALAKAAGLLDVSRLSPKQLGRNKSATSVILCVPSDEEQHLMEAEEEAIHFCVTP